MSKIEYYSNIVSEIETVCQNLQGEFPQPWVLEYSEEMYTYRHHPSELSNTLAAYIKLVRIVSLLNACICLMKNGFVQEVHSLGRAIDESCQDITFLIIPENLGANREKQLEMLSEFYKEITENPDDPLAVNSYHAVDRKYVRSAISNVMGRIGNPHFMRQVGKASHRLFSSFLHGAYVCIMESFNPGTGKFETNGLPSSSPRVQDCEEYFVMHIYQAILAAALVACTTSRNDLHNQILLMKDKVAQDTSCVAETASPPKNANKAT